MQFWKAGRIAQGGCPPASLAMSRPGRGPRLATLGGAAPDMAHAVPVKRAGRMTGAVVARSVWVDYFQIALIRLRAAT